MARGADFAGGRRARGAGLRPRAPLPTLLRRSERPSPRPGRAQSRLGDVPGTPPAAGRASPRYDGRALRRRFPASIPVTEWGQAQAAGGRTAAADPDVTQIIPGPAHAAQAGSAEIRAALSASRPSPVPPGDGAPPPPPFRPHPEPPKIPTSESAVKQRRIRRTSTR